MFSSYYSLIDSVRVYYAAREGDDGVAAFSAALLVSMLCLVNIASLLALLDLWRHGEFRFVTWILEHRLAPVIFALAVVAGHYALAVRAGDHVKRGAARNSDGMRLFRWYAIATGSAATLPFMVMATMRAYQG